MTSFRALCMPNCSSHEQFVLRAMLCNAGSCLAWGHICLITYPAFYMFLKGCSERQEHNLA